ncbi:hypothetical protein EV426DRAFT_606642, partial [Tirmania nivea]
MPQILKLAPQLKVLFFFIYQLGPPFVICCPLKGLNIDISQNSLLPMILVTYPFAISVTFLTLLAIFGGHTVYSRARS